MLNPRRMTSGITPSPAEQAARNNAVWCDAVCRAIGSAGEFDEQRGLWLHRHRSLPLYPNIVTIAPPEKAEPQLARIAELCVALPTGFAVKDSFAALDLVPLGFSVLFEAHWIWRPPAARHGERLIENVDWA